jgi:hypothetical protein
VTFRREELAVPLVATIDGDQEDGGAVYGEEGADGVEFGCEDLEDDEGEGELAEGGAHVGAFKGPLGGPDLSESGRVFHRVSARAEYSSCGCSVGLLLGRENHGPRPVKTEVEMLVNVCLPSG